MQLRIVDVIEQRCNTSDIALVAIYLRETLKHTSESLLNGQRKKMRMSRLMLKEKLMGFGHLPKNFFPRSAGLPPISTGIYSDSEVT